MKTPDNESMNSEKAAVATPPPFRQDTSPAEQPEQTASPTLAQRISQLGLNETDAIRLTELTTGLDNDAVTSELLTTLARGVTHDNDVENADATGYLRGRNEKIETVMHPRPENDAPEIQPVFPRYCRRSIWD